MGRFEVFLLLVVLAAVAAATWFTYFRGAEVGAVKGRLGNAGRHAFRTRVVVRRDASVPLHPRVALVARGRLDLSADQARTVADILEKGACLVEERQG